MSDAAIPDRIGQAARWAIAGIFLFVFVLGASDSFREGKPLAGAVYSGLFLATFVVAVKWNAIATYLGGRKVTLFYIGLAVLCALGLGVALGGLMGRTDSDHTEIKVTTAADTGRIAWNFEQQLSGQANFLTLGRLNEGEIHVVGFGAGGRNTSRDPITHFKGYVRSDLTNARLPIYLLAEVAEAPKHPFDPQFIPTRPEETYGIPGLAAFDIVTYDNTVIQTGVDGTPLSQFLRDFGSFTLVLEYDGIVVEKQYTRKDIDEHIRRFEHQSGPQVTIAPRVRRKPDATPPRQPSLPFLPPVDPAVPKPPAKIEAPQNGKVD